MVSSLFSRKRKGISVVQEEYLDEKTSNLTDEKKTPAQLAQPAQPAPPVSKFDMQSNEIDFEIGDNTVRQLVTISQVQDHLKLLNAFHHLREEAMGTTSEACGADCPKETRFSVLISMAVERFFVMMDKGKLDNYSLIPLDVMMVWHTYCLNPRAYRNDSVRDERFAMPDRFPLDEFTKRLTQNGDHYIIEPAQAEVDRWEMVTSTRFDPLVHFKTSRWRIVIDPYTHQRIQVPWMMQDGHGYSQQDFKFKSESGEFITHNVLALRRFFEDMIKCLDGETIGIG